MWPRTEKQAKIYGTRSQVVSAGAAVIALVAIVWQINTIRVNSREATARQIFRGFQELAVNHPELAKGKFNAMTEVEKIKYESYMRHLLYSCEEIITTFPTDKEWRHACKSNVRDHMNYICNEKYKDVEILKSYDTKMRKFLQEFAEEISGQFPGCDDWARRAKRLIEELDGKDYH